MVNVCVLVIHTGLALGSCNEEREKNEDKSKLKTLHVKINQN